MASGLRAAFLVPKWAVGAGPELPVTQYGMVDAVLEIRAVVGYNAMLMNRVWFGVHT
jgi:hypothetical protein